MVRMEDENQTINYVDKIHTVIKRSYESQISQIIHKGIGIYNLKLLY